MVRGSTEPLGERKGRQQHVREGGGRTQGELLRGVEGRVTAIRKASLMTDKDARQDNTEHRRHRKVGWKEAGEQCWKFQNTQIGSRNWGQEQGRREEVGGARKGKQ